MIEPPVHLRQQTNWKKNFFSSMYYGEHMEDISFSVPLGGALFLLQAD